MLRLPFKETVTVSVTHVCLMYQNYRSLQKRNSFRLALITNFEFVYDNITLYYMFLKKKKCLFSSKFSRLFGPGKRFLFITIRSQARRNLKNYKMFAKPFLILPPLTCWLRMFSGLTIKTWMLKYNSPLSLFINRLAIKEARKINRGNYSVFS